VGLGLDELAQVERARWIPDPLLAGLASVLLLAGYVASAALWGVIVRDLGGPALPLGVAVQVFMIANLGRYIPGKVWQIAGLAVLARGRGVAPATAAAAGALGQGLALIAASALGLLALLGAPAPYRVWGAWGAVLVPVLVLVGSVPAVFARVSSAWFRLTRTEPPQTGLRSARALAWLALYGLNWALYAFSFWVLARSLDLAGSPVAVASAFAGAYVLGYVMLFAPAGLGPREGFLVAFLTPHVGAASAGVLAVVARIWTTVVELVPAGALWAAHVLGRPQGAGDPPGGTGA